MRLIDIGVNLTDRQFRRDRSAVVDRAIAAGVDRLILTGTTEDESALAASLATARPGVLWATAGVHPHHAQNCGPHTLEKLRELYRFPEVVAIGECGLDFNRNFSPASDQERWFAAQIELAVELGAPLFLHERDAHERFVDILTTHRPAGHPAVVHCFTGQQAELERYLALDLHIGITGWICDERRGLHLRELVDRIPADRLMIETDAPWLLPRDLRPRPKSRRNEPAYLPHILRSVAACRDESPEALARSSVATSAAFFGIPLD